MPTRYINCTRETCYDVNLVLDPEIELGYIDVCPTCGATSVVSLNQPLKIDYEFPNKHTENTLILKEIVEPLSIYTKENNRKKDNHEKNQHNTSNRQK